MAGVGNHGESYRQRICWIKIYKMGKFEILVEIGKHTLWDKVEIFCKIYNFYRSNSYKININILRKRLYKPQEMKLIDHILRNWKKTDNKKIWNK